jgi:transposase-like protein
MRHTSDFWAARIAELERGHRISEVARRHAVREGTLVWWRSELRRRARKLTVQAPAQRFLPAVLDSFKASPPRPHNDLACAEFVLETPRGSVSIRGQLTLAQFEAMLAAVRGS